MIDAILSALIGAGIDARRSSEADVARTDTVPALVSLVDPVVGGSLWPLRLPEDAPEKNGAYQLAGLSDVEVDGYRLGRIDTYVLSLRSPTFDPLRAMSDDLATRVAEQQGVTGWEITDAATDYEHEPRQYRAHFELQATTLATDSPSLPAAFVHAAGAAAEPNALATVDVRQTVTEQVAVVLVADQGNLDAQRLAASGVLLGLESSDAMSPLEYAGGQRVAVSGRHIYWRELYSYQRMIRT